MISLRIVFGSVLIIAAAFVVVMNWGSLIVNERNKRNGIEKHSSASPFVPLILSAVAYLAYPMHPKGWVALIPALDLATWATLVLLIRLALKGRRS